MLRVGTTVMQVADLRRAIAFWRAALGYELKRELRPDDDFMIIIPPAGGPGPWLAFDVVETAPDRRPRVHLDLYAGERADQLAEVERLVALGASRVEWDYPPEPDFVVLADTEGNLFCVIDTTGATGLPAW